MNRVKRFFREYSSPIATVAIAVTVGVAYGSLYLLGVVYNDRLASQNAFLKGVNEAENNQTRVLCKLYISLLDNKDQSQDNAQLERICREKIKKASEKANTSSSATPAPKTTSQPGPALGNKQAQTEQGGSPAPASSTGNNTPPPATGRDIEVPNILPLVPDKVHLPF